MKSLNVGIFNDEKLGRELGKGGTENDILMFNRKTDYFIFTFMQPVEDKISPKSQIMSVIDAAVVSFENITQSVGETVLMLDSMKIKDGLIISKSTETDRVKSIIRGTSLDSFKIVDRDPIKIIESLKNLFPDRKEGLSTLIIIDQSFSVKGVGEVALGFVMRGSAKKHERLLLLPANKEITIRSIQIHDKDYDVAPCGTRLGMAIKGATVNEMRRGSVLCVPDTVKTGKEVVLSFKMNKFYGSLKDGTYHVTVGMQTVPVSVTKVNKNKIKIRSEKLFVYGKDDIFLLLDLNAKKLRFIGSGRPIANFK